MCVCVCVCMHADQQESHLPDILHPYTSKRSAIPVSQVTGRIRTKRVSVGLGSIDLAMSAGLVLPWKIYNRGKGKLLVEVQVGNFCETLAALSRNTASHAGKDFIYSNGINNCS